MSFADATDPIVSALRTLLAEQVPERLRAMIGNAGVYDDDNPSPVASTYGMPIPMTLAPTLRLPALLISRRSSDWRRIGKNDYLMTRFEIGYVLETTPAHLLEAHWPLLRSVFKAVIDSVLDDTLLDDSHPLSLAGVVEFEEERTQVSYGFVTDAGHENAYPNFVASIYLTHDDSLPVLTPVVLDDLTGLLFEVEKEPEEIVLASELASIDP